MEGKRVKDVLKNVVDCGAQSVDLAMKSKLVISIMFFIQGIYFVVVPVGSIYYDAILLSIMLILYGILSLLIFIFGSDNKILTAGKGAFDAGYRGFLYGKKMMIDKEVEFIDKIDIKPLENKARDENKQARELGERIRERRKEENFELKTPALIGFYCILIASGIVMITKIDYTVAIAHAFLGLLLIGEGVFSIYSLIKTKNIRQYSRMASFVLSLISIALGLILIIFRINSGAIIIRIMGVILLLKCGAEIFMYIKNKQLLTEGRNLIGKIREKGREIKNKDNQ